MRDFDSDNFISKDDSIYTDIVKIKKFDEIKEIFTFLDFIFIQTTDQIWTTAHALVNLLQRKSKGKTFVKISSFLMSGRKSSGFFQKRFLESRIDHKKIRFLLATDNFIVFLFGQELFLRELDSKVYRKTGEKPIGMLRLEDSLPDSLHMIKNEHPDVEILSAQSDLETKSVYILDSLGNIFVLEFQENIYKLNPISQINIQKTIAFAVNKNIFYMIDAFGSLIIAKIEISNEFITEEKAIESIQKTDVIHQQKFSDEIQIFRIGPNELPNELSKMKNKKKISVLIAKDEKRKLKKTLSNYNVKKCEEINKWPGSSELQQSNENLNFLQTPLILENFKQSEFKKKTHGSIFGTFDSIKCLKKSSFSNCLKFFEKKNILEKYVQFSSIRKEIDLDYRPQIFQKYCEEKHEPILRNQLICDKKVFMNIIQKLEPIKKNIISEKIPNSSTNECFSKILITLHFRQIILLSTHGKAYNLELHGGVFTLSQIKISKSFWIIDLAENSGQIYLFGHPHDETFSFDNMNFLPRISFGFLIRNH